MQLLFLLLLLSKLLLGTLTAAAAPPLLWKINTAPPSYLFGIVHAPYDRVLPAVPSDVWIAMLKSNNLHLEVVVNNTADNIRATCMPATYVGFFDPIRHNPPFDVYLREQMFKFHKNAKWPNSLESNEERCKFKNDAIRILKPFMAEEMDELKRELKVTVNSPDTADVDYISYRNGQISDVFTPVIEVEESVPVQVKEMAAKANQVFKLMQEKRNWMMARRIKDLLLEGMEKIESNFFAVSASRLVSLLEHVKGAGFRVAPLLPGPMTNNGDKRKNVFEQMPQMKKPESGRQCGLDEWPGRWQQINTLSCGL